MSVWAKPTRSKYSLLSLVGIVCIGLVLMTGMVQVTHSHASGQPDHDCSLCITAHHVIQVVVLISLVLARRPVVTLATEPSCDLPILLFFFDLASRPPPVAPAVA
jgi:hypothetical protein